jgi:hypothetical protein
MITPEQDEELRIVLTRIAALSEEDRRVFLASFYDVIEPLSAPRPHADPMMVAEGRRVLQETRPC